MVPTEIYQAVKAKANFQEAQRKAREAKRIAKGGKTDAEREAERAKKRRQQRMESPNYCSDCDTSGHCKHYCSACDEIKCGHWYEYREAQREDYHQRQRERGYW
jgi:hypothetical protein